MKAANSFGVVALAFTLSLSFAAAAAQTKHRTCGAQPGRTLQHFLNELNPGDTLVVSGTCNENVVIDERHHNLIIDGQGTAVINAVDADAPAVRVRGRNITIKGFRISGGRHGVQYQRGGAGTIDGNVIRNAGTHGIALHENSSARIVDNTVELNGGNGICVCEHSTADIGFRGDFATQASPNIVRDNALNGINVNDVSYAEIESNSVYRNQGAGITVNEGSAARIGFQAGVPGTFSGGNTVELNGNRGVLVTRSSTARIVENVIRNNTGPGVAVSRGSQADIAANAIDGNSGDGVQVSQGAGANLGSDSGGDVTDLPNTTVTNNGGFGVRCTVGGYLDGRQGTLNGASGAVSATAGCVNSLIP